jgi:putative nucleotidyltransferase with HDIG domain
MPKRLKLYIAGLVVASALALVAASLFFGLDSRIAIEVDGQVGTSRAEILVGLGFWILLALCASALPVRMPGGMLVTVSIAPVMAAASLGGPAAAGWVALLGTTEVRELRGRIPWYGTLANHAGIVLPATLGALVISLVAGDSQDLRLSFLGTVAGSVVNFLANVLLVSTLLSLRTGDPVRTLVFRDSRGFWANLLALAPLAWLMAEAFTQAAWAALLFALPLYTTRLAYQKFVEMREMFTQTIGALAEAVDKRDPYTSKHSVRVKAISVDIGREMRVNESELEALEWGGLLHDVGKIGVPDAVLLKQDRLTKDERMVMNAHPVLGAQIIAPVEKLAPELPIIRHHHEWYNGSGYPDRLIGDEIPKLARILHVADAFEAMTAARPYRMTPLTAEQALGELRKFAGIQFDPMVVDAFIRTSWVDDMTEAPRPTELRPIPSLNQVADRMTDRVTKPSAVAKPKARAPRPRPKQA